MSCLSDGLLLRKEGEKAEKGWLEGARKEARFL